MRNIEMIFNNIDQNELPQEVIEHGLPELKTKVINAIENYESALKVVIHMVTSIDITSKFSCSKLVTTWFYTFGNIDGEFDKFKGVVAISKWNKILPMIKLYEKAVKN